MGNPNAKFIETFLLKLAKKKKYRSQSKLAVVIKTVLMELPPDPYLQRLGKWFTHICKAESKVCWKEESTRSDSAREREQAKKCTESVESKDDCGPLDHNDEERG